MGTLTASAGRRLCALRERAAAPSSVRVDEDAAVLRGVKVLGQRSRNGRVYPPEVIREAAHLYSGASVRLNHPDDPDAQRDVGDVIGWLRDPRVGPDGDLYADLHYLKSHPFAPRLVEAARRNPRAMALSHNAEGETAERDGLTVVRRIVEVRSVDLVCDPATTQGLFESVTPRFARRRAAAVPSHRTTRPRGAAPMLLREWFDRIKLLPPTRRRIKRLFEAGMMDPDMPMSEADEALPPSEEADPANAAPMTADPAAMDPAEALRGGFRAAFSAIFDDSTLDVKAKVARAKQLLTTAEQLLADGEEIPEAEEEEVAEGEEEEAVAEGEHAEPDGDELVEECDEMDGKKKPVAESARSLRRRLALLEAEKHCRRLCEAAGLADASETFVASLARMASDRDRQTLIDERKAERGAAVGGKGGVPSWVPEGRTKEKTPDASREVKTTEDFVQRLTGRSVSANGSH